MLWNDRRARMLYLHMPNASVIKNHIETLQYGMFEFVPLSSDVVHWTICMHCAFIHCLWLYIEYIDRAILFSKHTCKHTHKRLKMCDCMVVHDDPVYCECICICIE